MSASANLLTELQEDLAARAAADAYFADVAVITERKAEILSEIQRKLGVVTAKGGKSGACVVAMQIVADVDEAQTEAPIFNPRITFRALENPTINQGATGTKKSALSLAVRLVELMRYYHPVGFSALLVPDKPCIRPVDDPVAPVAYEVVFTTQAGSSAVPAKVATPTIYPAGCASTASVTLSCATAGAAIYYTLDGSHPWSGNNEATLYSAAIAVQTACTLRAAAFKSGMIGSDVNAAVFS